MYTLRFLSVEVLNWKCWTGHKNMETFSIYIYLRYIKTCIPFWIEYILRTVLNCVKLNYIFCQLTFAQNWNIKEFWIQVELKRSEQNEHKVCLRNVLDADNCPCGQRRARPEREQPSDLITPWVPFSHSWPCSHAREGTAEWCGMVWCSLVCGVLFVVWCVV
jgi:hypothetical protein